MMKLPVKEINIVKYMERRRPTALWASMDCYRDSFTFYIHEPQRSLKHKANVMLCTIYANKTNDG
jgi:hypothetical protein